MVSGRGDDMGLKLDGDPPLEIPSTPGTVSTAEDPVVGPARDLEAERATALRDMERFAPGMLIDATRLAPVVKELSEEERLRQALEIAEAREAALREQIRLSRLALLELDGDVVAAVRPTTSPTNPQATAAVGGVATDERPAVAAALGIDGAPRRGGSGGGYPAATAPGEGEKSGPKKISLPTAEEIAAGNFFTFDEGSNVFSEEDGLPIRLRMARVVTKCLEDYMTANPGRIPPQYRLARIQVTSRPRGSFNLTRDINVYALRIALEIPDDPIGTATIVRDAEYARLLESTYDARYAEVFDAARARHGVEVQYIDGVDLSNFPSGNVDQARHLAWFAMNEANSRRLTLRDSNDTARRPSIVWRISSRRDQALRGGERMARIFGGSVFVRVNEITTNNGWLELTGYEFGVILPVNQPPTAPTAASQGATALGGAKATAK